MESGVAPPPARRSAPKSLLGARRPSEPGDPTTSSQATTATEDRSLREQRLENMLHAEANENRRLQAALREQTVKFERSLRHQSQLEEDLLERDARVRVLGDELRILKQKKQSTDSELAQSTADYMNGQARWLEQVDLLTEEINQLKSKLTDAKTVATGLEKEVADARERERRRDADEQKRAARERQNVKVAANSLERHQNDLLIKELRARHSQLLAEISETKAVNERLREDNENFQYLLVERTVAGDLAVPAGAGGSEPRAAGGSVGGRSDAAASQTLADEEVFEYEPAQSGPRHGAAAGAPSLGDEGRSRADEAKSMADEDKSLGDEEKSLGDEGKSPAGRSKDEQSTLESPTSDASEPAAERDAGFLQKTVNKQQFELQSLRNHNRALKLSLERLVDRLLDNKMFSRAVEEAVSTNIVQRFRERLASSTMELDRRLSTASSSDSGALPAGGRQPAGLQTPVSTQPSAAAWSNMIFNTQYSGTPNRRVVSLGIDNEYKGPPSPIAPHHTGSTGRAVSTAGSVDGLRTAGRIRDPLSRHSNASSTSLNSAESSPPQLQVTKRIDSQSGLRKLRLRE